MTTLHPRRFALIALLGVLALRPSSAAAQPAQPPAPHAVPATPEAVAQALGFTPQEIEKIKAGEVITKKLHEGSDTELAGVVAAFFKQPVSELVDVVMQGKLLAKEKDVQALHIWKPGDSGDDAFAEAGLAPTESSEAKRFAHASPGDDLNLSTAEIALFKSAHPAPTPEAVNVPLCAMLKARYTAYLHDGLKGIAPYTRGRKESSPADELALAIRETMPAAPQRDFFEALLTYPANQPANVDHRFYWLKQTVEDRPTFVLAHRAEIHNDSAALIAEEQFYVGHSYNSNFIAGGALAVEGGSLVFYLNRTFTDQVAGFGSGTKHGIGRGQMLADVASSLKRYREELEK